LSHSRARQFIDDFIRQGAGTRYHTDVAGEKMCRA
jgi:hypothetical protein